MAKPKAAPKPTATASQKTTAKSSQNKKTSGSLSLCAKDHQAFCYVCASYVYKKSRMPFTDRLQKKYKQIFGVTNLKNLDHRFSGSCVCASCKTRLHSDTLQFTRPAVWHAPSKKNHEDCYICNFMRTNDTGLKIYRALQLHKSKDKNKKRNAYNGNLNVELADQSKDAAPLGNYADSVWEESEDDQRNEPMEYAAAADDNYY